MAPKKQPSIKQPSRTGLVRLDPSPHYFLPGVPHVKQTVLAAKAAELVASGAFVYADQSSPSSPRPAEPADDESN